MRRKIRPLLLEKGQIILRFLSPMAYATSFLVSLIAAVLVVIVMVLVGEYTKTGGRWLLTALVLAAYFFFSLGPVSLAQRRPDSRVWRVALAVGVAALLLLMTGIWGTPNSDAFWKIAAIVTALGLVLIYFAVVELQQGTLARQFAIKVAAVGAAMVCLGIAVEIKWPPYWWVFTLLVFVWLGAILAPPVIGLARRIQGR